MVDIEKLRAQRLEITGQARAITDEADAEERELTVDEARRFEDLISRANQLKSRIERAEVLQMHEEDTTRSYEPPTRPDVGDAEEQRAQTAGQARRFRSLGEQARAVLMASKPGGFIDPRLQSRAVTGMSEGVPADGGFLVQTDQVTELLARAYQTGQIANRCRRMTISGNANGMTLNGIDETSRVAGSRHGGVRGYWVAEGGDKGASKPKFRQIELRLHKLAALCYLTDELEQDAGALNDFLVKAFTEEFGFLLDDACFRGNGAGQPQGILNSPALISVEAEDEQQAATVVTENIVNMYSRLYAPSIPKSVWFINQDVQPQLFTMSLQAGVGGMPVYMPPGGLSQAPYGTLMGRPVIPVEQCSTLGTVGDIVLADMDEYQLIDKGGIQSAVSIHVQFANDETVLRFVYRVDGQSLWSDDLTPYQGTNTVSPFVALASRT
jgi:HK97 family phage major capsid protein